MAPDISELIFARATLRLDNIFYPLFFENKRTPTKNNGVFEENSQISFDRRKKYMKKNKSTRIAIVFFAPSARK